MIDIHNNILDKLLKSNRPQRDIVDGDGNCFFESLLKCTETELSRSCSTASEIHQKVCNHMMENVAEYMNFFPTERGLDEELFLQKVESLQNNGYVFLMQ